MESNIKAYTRDFLFLEVTLKYLILMTLMMTACGPVDYNAIPGPKGDPGERGEVGAAGPAGEAGVPSNVLPIQLCPNVVVAYPSSFPETAFCINHKLYAVYVSGPSQVFLAEIPPGNYASTSPQGCNLHVGTDCSVTN